MGHDDLKTMMLIVDEMMLMKALMVMMVIMIIMVMMIMTIMNHDHDGDDDTPGHLLLAVFVAN